ncbi:MAG TPA: glycine cleavage T C-terminal barrel domain-containing protein [Thermoanaerobaculia bacterium]|nr:glycine cleavage T C-terminal barrel domain-containing protein [Thermoanaerobaculia bacterium]
MSGGPAAQGAERPRRLHLHAWHRQRGATFVVRRGTELPARYGDAEAELARLRDGCALVDQSDCGRLELLGADRARFLNGLVTVDVVRLVEGEALRGWAADVKGRILADLTVLHCGDRLWLATPPGRAELLREHLLRYRVADRVEVLAMDDLLPLTLAGGGLAGALAGAGVEVPPAVAPPRRSHWRAELFGSEVHLERSDRLGVPGMRVWVSSSIASLVADELCARLGAAPVGDDACDVARLEAGIARFGVDFDERNLPGEVDVEGTVDWRKGCYLGQEVVARLHYRGQPARLLRRLRLAGDRVPEPGEEVSSEERAAGTVTSAARSPRHGVLAIALVQRRAAEPGTTVALAGGGEARVEELTPLG